MINLIFSGIFLLLLVFLNLSGGFSIVIFWLYFSMSIITFCFYALDKLASIKSKSRIQERTLFLLILACGWPGALLAQQLIRHKSVKIRFIRFSWYFIFINLFLLSFYILQG